METRTDFSNYLFRCSSLGKLMTGIKFGLTENQKETFDAYNLRYKGNGKPLTENQTSVYFDLGSKKFAKAGLSNTTKTYLKELHKEELFNRRKEITNKYLSKGIQVEENSITLYSEVTGKLFIKNKERFNNSFITGEPDNVQGMVRDIKSSWDFSTFPMYDEEIKNMDYYWQLQGYMNLTGLTEAELIYCLVDSPELIIEDEKRRTSWKLGFIELPESLSNEIELNMTYSDIPKELRIKVFKVEKSIENVMALQNQIKLARKYMTELSLSVANEIKIIQNE